MKEYLLKVQVLEEKELQHTQSIEDTGGSTKQLQIRVPQSAWNRVASDNMPPEGKYVEVCTADGQIYVSSVLCGKFPPNVKWWKEMSELPDELKDQAKA